jgi:hypothetical protein
MVCAAPDISNQQSSARAARAESDDQVGNRKTWRRVIAPFGVII